MITAQHSCDSGRRRARRGVKVNLVRERLRNQKLLQSEFRTPDETVAWLGAVQSQEYAGAKWALGQRANGLTDADIEDAFNRGTILRTHVLRPTWHFVAPADIRWLLALSGPRVHAVSAHYYRKMELDDRLFARSRKVFERALAGGKHLTRSELARALERAGILAKGPRLAYLVMCSELNGVICSGSRQGKQFTYALLDQRAPNARSLSRDDALAELTHRYFNSHGPATLRDYVWWSGLTVREARTGLEMIKPTLVQEALDGLVYWFPPSTSRTRRATSTVHLLPVYDEHLIAYKDRGIVLDESCTRGPWSMVAEFPNQLVVSGRVTGAWGRTVSEKGIHIRVKPFRSLTRVELRGLEAAAERHGRFMKLPVTLTHA
jgi:DNA glycosylase AlkZ-like